MCSSLLVETSETFVEMIVFSVPTAWTDEPIIVSVDDARKHNAAQMCDPLLCNANVGPTFRIIGHRGIFAAPTLNDALLLGTEAGLKRTVNMGICCEFMTLLIQLVVVCLNARDCGASNISELRCCARRRRASRIFTCG